MSLLVDIAKASVWAVNALVGTATGGKVGMQEEPAKVVLVPPLFERDLRLRSRSEGLLPPPLRTGVACASFNRTCCALLTAAAYLNAMHDGYYQLPNSICTDLHPFDGEV